MDNSLTKQKKIGLIDTGFFNRMIRNHGFNKGRYLGPFVMDFFVQQLEDFHEQNLSFRPIINFSQELHTLANLFSPYMMDYVNRYFSEYRIENQNHTNNEIGESNKDYTRVESNNENRYFRKLYEKRIKDFSTENRRLIDQSNQNIGTIYLSKMKENNDFRKVINQNFKYIEVHKDEDNEGILEVTNNASNYLYKVFSQHMVHKEKNVGESYLEVYNHRNILPAGEKAHIERRNGILTNKFSQSITHLSYFSKDISITENTGGKSQHFVTKSTKIQESYYKKNLIEGKIDSILVQNENVKNLASSVLNFEKNISSNSNSEKNHISVRSHDFYPDVVNEHQNIKSLFTTVEEQKLSGGKSVFNENTYRYNSFIQENYLPNNETKNIGFDNHLTVNKSKLVEFYRNNRILEENSKQAISKLDQYMNKYFEFISNTQSIYHQRSNNISHNALRTLNNYYLEDRLTEYDATYIEKMSSTFQMFNSQYGRTFSEMDIHESNHYGVERNNLIQQLYYEKSDHFANEDFYNTTDNLFQNKYYKDLIEKSEQNIYQNNLHENKVLRRNMEQFFRDIKNINEDLISKKLYVFFEKKIDAFETIKNSSTSFENIRQYLYLIRDEFSRIVNTYKMSKSVKISLENSINRLEEVANKNTIVGIKNGDLLSSINTHQSLFNHQGNINKFNENRVFNGDYINSKSVSYGFEYRKNYVSNLSRHQEQSFDLSYSKGRILNTKNVWNNNSNMNSLTSNYSNMVKSNTVKSNSVQDITYMGMTEKNKIKNYGFIDQTLVSYQESIKKSIDQHYIHNAFKGDMVNKNYETKYSSEDGKGVNNFQHLYKTNIDVKNQFVDIEQNTVSTNFMKYLDRRDVKELLNRNLNIFEQEFIPHKYITNENNQYSYNRMLRQNNEYSERYSVDKSVQNTLLEESFITHYKKTVLSSKNYLSRDEFYFSALYSQEDYYNYVNQKYESFNFQIGLLKESINSITDNVLVKSSKYESIINRSEKNEFLTEDIFNNSQTLIEVMDNSIISTVLSEETNISYKTETSSNLEEIRYEMEKENRQIKEYVLEQVNDIQFPTVDPKEISKLKREISNDIFRKLKVENRRRGS